MFRVMLADTWAVAEGEVSREEAALFQRITAGVSLGEEALHESLAGFAPEDRERAHGQND